MKKLQLFIICLITALFMMSCNNAATPTPTEKLYTVSITGGTAHPTSGTEGTVITITANTPENGVVFKSWTTTTSGVTFENATSSTTTFVMPASDVVISTQVTPLPPTAPLTALQNYNGTAGTSSNYVTFGIWPQTKLTDTTVTVDESITFDAKLFTYYWGSDNNWYAKIDNDYYKVEPIKWRIVTSNYDHDNDSSTSGKKLLLAESIIMNCTYYAYEERTFIGENTVYENNYEFSSLRGFLNGLEYPIQISDHYMPIQTYELPFHTEEDGAKGFLQTAFSAIDQNAIATTKVINNKESTNPKLNSTEFNLGNNTYASNTITEDKIFVLSMQEVTDSEFGFADYNEQDNARIRKTTDFAKSTSAVQTDASGSSDFWWLRSPDSINSKKMLVINDKGAANESQDTNNHIIGVVPALCLE